MHPAGVVLAALCAVLGFVAVYLAAVRDSDWWLFAGVTLITAAVFGVARAIS